MWHQSCIRRGMTGDNVYLVTAERVSAVNRFYTRRVLQRFERGEITMSDATKLLLAAAERSTVLEGTVVQRWVPDSLA